MFCASEVVRWDSYGGKSYRVPGFSQRRIDERLASSDASLALQPLHGQHLVAGERIEARALG